MHTAQSLQASVRRTRPHRLVAPQKVGTLRSFAPLLCIGSGSVCLEDWRLSHACCISVSSLLAGRRGSSAAMLLGIVTSLFKFAQVTVPLADLQQQAD